MVIINQHDSLAGKKPTIRYDMFRDQLKYLEIMDRIKAALIGIGIAKISSYNTVELAKVIKIDGLEELMLATYAMNKLIVKYLKDNDMSYTGGHRVGDLYTAVQRLVHFVKPPSKNHHFLSDEAEATEKVSRACYAWMKNFRMLKGQKIDNAWAWPMIAS